MNRTVLFAVLTLGSASMLSGQGKSPNANRRPEEIEARPPIHLRANPALTKGPQGYTPAQTRKAYGLDLVSGNGAGQTIAIVDAYGSGTIQNDVNVFSTQFGLPQISVPVYYPQGKPKRSDNGWALETSLDVEWAHAMAPGARIIVVAARSATLSDLLAAVDYAVTNLGAKQVSMSWGGSEFSSESSYDFHFNKTGVTFTASSGDSGSGVMWPAVSPYVVSVGGTTLNLDASGAVLSETAWSESGGGISAYEKQPSYQNVWQNSGKRGVPDVSYDGDPNTGFPVYISNYYRSKGWITVGGTSAGAPQWAAIFALTNAARATSLTSANSVIYSLVYSNNFANYSTYFRDIVKGSNGYLADTFYDYVTGLGSPRAGSLIPALRSN